MNIKELEAKYELSFDEIAKILRKQHIKISIENLSNIPNDWVSIIEESLKPKTNNLEGINNQIKNLSNSKKERPSKQEINKRKQQVYTQSKRNFYAFVKHVGPQKEHAFVKPIDDLNDIGSVDLFSKDNGDFKLIEDCSKIEKGQIIVCYEKSTKFRLAKIQSAFIEGVVVSSSRFLLIDWLSFNVPQVLSNGISFDGKIENENYITSILKVNLRAGSLSCLIQNDITNHIKIREVSISYFKNILKKEKLDDNDIALIRFYQNNQIDSFFDELLGEQFDQSVTELSDLEVFLSKWMIISPERISLRGLKNFERISEYFEFWFKKKLPIGFWEENLIDALVQCKSLMDDGERAEVLKKLDYDHIELISKALNNYFHFDFVVEILEHFKILNSLLSFSNLDDKEELIKELKARLSPNLSFDLWVYDKSGNFHREKAISSFSEQSITVQKDILKELKELKDEDLEFLLPLKTELLSHSIEQKLYSLLVSKLMNEMHCISFDIESNRDDIFEIGWVNAQNKWKLFSTKDEINEGIETFKVIAENSKNIIVGHNIVEWDLPILSRYNLKIKKEQIWDTLLIETFLSPEFKNYALITAHNAKDDALLTMDLFANQLLRIIYTSDEKLIHLFKFLPNEIVQLIISLKNNFIFNWEPLNQLLREKEKFFRPQPILGSLVDSLKSELSNSKCKSKLIVGATTFKNEILHLDNIQFHSDDKTPKNYYKLNLNKIMELEDSLTWVKNVLINFIEYNLSLNKPTYWGLLPTLVKIQVEKNVRDTFQLFYPLEEIKWEIENLIFLTIPELIIYRNQLSQLDTLEVFTLQNDLLSIEYKELLKEVSLDFLINNSNTEDHIWLKFSGGQSITSLSKKQCETLEVNIPELYDNFWIKKVSLDKFNIWGNYDWEKLVDSFNVENKVAIEFNSNEIKNDHTFFTKISAADSFKSGVIRYNPESLYRSRYWVFQKQLIDQIVFQSKPSILLIQNYKEIESLRNYFIHLGYYIPDNSISIARRLELLHQNTSKYKLIIEVTQNLNKIVNSNYKDSLNIIIDSFDISENYYAAINSKYIQKLDLDRTNNELQTAEEDLEINNVDNSYSKKTILSDKHFLLQLLKPRVSSIRNLIHKADPSNQLWLLDSRLNDFPELHKSWKASIRHFKIWNNNEAYENAVKEADVHIQSTKPIKEIPYDLETIKDILKQVFLDNKYDWRANQIPYLDLILKGEQDQLVTLPTGGGKSLLFQAPALFKSTFTNKLTIVVTPLKALMEDQVDALWQKGFFGSVEYLNSDRSTDIQSIYRALAGGELSLLFVTPERFRSRSFNNALQLRMQSDGGLEYAVFDEAHCVSQWGHEFRPDYFNCAKKIQQIKVLSEDNFPLLLFSATVSEKIYNDFNLIFS
ncbi:DEAD/DEAH box helicase [Algibacter mikhailovii]|uniref:DEAD/DEAH box helicase n=1 Tax=Algibacter mikhailovii TaxID=425498 RepID=UPI0024941E37|nr:DEAD/DEAH box helicase [Algibacter mikhailovii]